MARCQRAIDSREFAEWQEFFGRFPFGTTGLFVKSFGKESKPKMLRGKAMIAAIDLLAPATKKK